MDSLGSISGSSEGNFDELDETVPVLGSVTDVFQEMGKPMSRPFSSILGRVVPNDRVIDVPFPKRKVFIVKSEEGIWSGMAREIQSGASSQVYAFRNAVVKLEKKAAGENRNECEILEFIHQETDGVGIIPPPHLVKKAGSLKEGILMHRYVGDGFSMRLQGRSMDKFAPLTKLFLGLDCLSKAGIHHGDIKPENLLVDRRDGVMLADFGGSRSLDKIARTASPFYTNPRYLKKFIHRTMTPNQCKKHDLYALAVTVLVLITREKITDSKGNLRDPREMLTAIDHKGLRALLEKSLDLRLNPDETREEWLDFIAVNFS